MRGVATLAVLALPVLLAGCDDKSHAATPAPDPAPEVSAVVVQPHAVPLTWEYAGRVTAFRRVEVRARVGGLILERRYTEGARVRAGDVLFRLDPAPYQAAVARAAAQLGQADAQREKAVRDLHRAEALLNTPAGSPMARDDAATAAALADANAAAARAQVQTEALNLGWTTVTAPLGGVTSLEALPEGSLVAANTLLTEITQTDPVYASFAFTDEDLETLRTLLRDGRAEGDPKHLSARITLSDGPYPQAGTVDYTDSSVDERTGTVRGRALFANPDGRLLPGQFVRVRIGGITLRDALTVPQAAVMQDATGPYAWVVAADGRAQRRALVLGQAVGDSWVVERGLAAGDEVVTAGALKVLDGRPVRVTPDS